MGETTIVVLSKDRLQEVTSPDQNRVPRINQVKPQTVHFTFLKDVLLNKQKKINML